MKSWRAVSASNGFGNSSRNPSNARVDRFPSPIAQKLLTCTKIVQRRHFCSNLSSIPSTEWGGKHNTPTFSTPTPLKIFSINTAVQDTQLNAGYASTTAKKGPPRRKVRYKRPLAHRSINFGGSILWDKFGYTCGLAPQFFFQGNSLFAQFWGNGEMHATCTPSPVDTRLYWKPRFVCWTTSRILR